MDIAASTVPARPITSAAPASIRIGVNSWSGEALSTLVLPATTAKTIESTGTPVDSTQVSTRRWITPAAWKFSGTPPRSAATATGRSTRSDCR